MREPSGGKRASFVTSRRSGGRAYSLSVQLAIRLGELAAITSGEVLSNPVTSQAERRHPPLRPSSAPR
jgi:hypothetical protein